MSRPRYGSQGGGGGRCVCVCVCVGGVMLYTANAICMSFEGIYVKYVVMYGGVGGGEVEGRKEMFHLTTHSTHFIYGYMASEIWLRTTQIAREETLCRHMGYSFRLAATVLLYASSHRQDNTYHGLCYTSRGVLA